MALLDVHRLTVGYRTPAGVLRAVDDVSFTLEPGRSLGFVGESGCGKTTVGMALMGLLPEHAMILSGRMDFNGRNLAVLTPEQWRDIRGRDIAMIFQAAMNALNPVLRVDEQIREAVAAHEPDLSQRELDERVRDLFRRVHIPEDRMRAYPHEYSGGMKQRVVIAMALSCTPRLIIADEPTTALDVIVQDQILREIRDIREQTRTELIFISHDIAVVSAVCDDICVMYGGRIVEAGTRAEVFHSPRHPYTRALLGSYLSLDNIDRIRIPDMQERPDQISGTDACRFSPNCRACSRDCRKAPPDWIHLSPTHKALCCRETLIRKPHEPL